MGIAGQLYQSSLHFTVSFTQKSKRKAVRMLMKTGLKHNCVKAQFQVSLKSISMYICVSTGVCRCACASGLRTKLQGAAPPRSACVGCPSRERHGYQSWKWLTSSVSVSLQQLSKATEGDFSEGRLDISCAVLGDACGWKMEQRDNYSQKSAAWWLNHNRIGREEIISVK